MTHTETIKCPQCGTIQQAEVMHTHTTHGNIYLHLCRKCKYIITQKDWDRQDAPKPRPP